MEAKYRSDTLMVSGLYTFNGVLGFVSQLVQAKLFGTSIEMSNYFAIYSLPMAINGLIPIVTVSIVLPSLMKYSRDDYDIRQLQLTLFVLAIGLGVLIALAGFVGSGFLVAWLIPHADLVQFKHTAISISRALWITTGMSVITNYLITARFSEKRFGLASLMPALSPLSIVFSALILSSRFGVMSLALGYFLGGVLQLVILLPGWLSQWWSNRLSIRHPEIGIIASRIIPMILSQLPFTTPLLIAAFWLTRLESGNLSYFSYCISIVGFFSVSISSGLSTVSFPRIAEQVVAGKRTSALSDLESRLRLVFLVAIPISIIAIVLRKPLLRIGLQRGAFDETSVQGTASIMPWYLLGMIAISGINLVRNLYYSMGGYVRIGLLGVLVPSFYFGLSGLLMQRWSASGIGLAYAISYFLYLIIAMAWIPNTPHGLWSSRLITYIAKVMAIATISGLISALVFIAVRSRWQAFVSVVASGGAGVLVFSCIAFLASPIPEFRYLVSRIRGILIRA